MIVKVSDVMRHVRNHFIHTSITADWSLIDGVLSPADSLTPGMWIAIAVDHPSAPFGVFQLDENGGIPGIPDIHWTGTVYRLNPPADFLRLCGDIACWAAAVPDPSVTGEKLGEYSMTRKAIDWQTAFAPMLAPYKRMYAEVNV